MKSNRIFLSLCAAAAAVTGLGASAQPVAGSPVAPMVLQNSIMGPAIHVADVERSLKFYRDILGMQVRMAFGPKGKQDVIIGFGPDTTKPSLLLLAEKGATPVPVQHSHSLNRILLVIENTNDLAGKLRAAGFQAPDPALAHGTSMILNTVDPDGYKLEIIDAKQVAAMAPRR
jgi:catechol 2,3-dioxygenase-like lactoylglutathione lyase family enzyme